MSVMKPKTALTALALCLCTALSGPAAAQTAAPPPVAPVAPQLSPAHVEMAVEVVKLSGMGRSLDVIVPQMVDRAKALFIQTRPEIAGEVDKSVKALQGSFDKENAEAMSIAGKAFAARLSEAELKDISAFFKSPVGQKFVSSQPAIMDVMFRDLDDFTARLSQIVIDRLRDDLKKRGVQF